MPIIVETLPARLSAMDLGDLQKIYQDAPVGLLPSYCDIHDASNLLSTLCPSTNTNFYVARFNGRLLGAVTVTKQSNIFQAMHLCVRKVTRNRGVGKRLIEVIEQIANQQNRVLCFSIPKHQQRNDLPAWLQAQL